jgi:DNA processing protein
MEDPATPVPPHRNPDGVHACLALAAVLGHRTRGVGDLLRRGVAAGALLDGEPAALARLPGATARALQGAAPRGRSLARRLTSLQRALDGCGSVCLPITDPRYPPALREIDDPPPWLFCRGSADALSRLDTATVAMVGSRRASHAGLTLARRLASRLAAGGYAICSGLALGIDGAAHAGALESGRTVAVLGTGIDAIYPRRHAGLAAQILARGCLLSELPPGTAPHRGQFPRRNRIISGLARATVIVEAALPSGSLHTAAAALEQGRDVFVLPWSLLHTGGAGCLYLLRDGATPLTSLEELDDHFPLLRHQSCAGASHPGDAADAENGAGEPLLSLIGDTEVSVQVLAAASGMALPKLLADLGRLEAAGLLRRGDGGYLLAQCKTCVPRGSC